jgi:hypothetical protein
MFESLASCFAFRCSASLNMTALFMRRGPIEIVDEIRHFYQFTVAAQSSYPVSQPAMLAFADCEFMLSSFPPLPFVRGEDRGEGSVQSSLDVEATLTLPVSLIRERRPIVADRAQRLATIASDKWPGT